jgi:hypothetical protein
LILCGSFSHGLALQKYFYRYSKTRGKADYFEGRDDSGVVSARFVEEAGANDEYKEFFQQRSPDQLPEGEADAYARLLENCIALGSTARPDTSAGTVWSQWFQENQDRCRILFAINTVGAGRGSTMLWETNPPRVHAEGPQPWISEQETAATHLLRNLQEIDAMCATGWIAARVQMLVCEPIPAKWTEWIDAQLVHCGGKPWPLDRAVDEDMDMEDRPSPVQIVVVASATTADSCHDLKSGLMEKRTQDLILAPPHLGKGGNDATQKTTNPDLVSSGDFDLHVAMKWTTLVSVRAVNSFLQASADMAAAASTTNPPSPTDNGPSSPFLVPSFVRVAYVSEENSKVAKWRMHGDFFHPAAWEICKDSFDMTWIPNSLSGGGGVNGLCDADSNTAVARKLSERQDCGQWWAYFTELQMPTSPEVYANEKTPPPVLGGSNFFWMVTERQRVELVQGMVCRHEGKSDCPAEPQAVIPLGDLESFLVNFTPNTALGKKHVKGRRPGYSQEDDREADRQRVLERKQLQDHEEIEKALFDYTIYPAALFHKDATLKAARARDAALTTHRNAEAVGPQTVKSSYYDVTITKPRGPVLGWCQAAARRGLCTLYADYFRTSNDERCMEACGLKRDFAPL